MLPLLAANLKIMLRDRQTLLWAVAFPLILVVVFGIFDVSNLGSADLGIVDLANTTDSRLLRGDLAGVEYLDLQSGYASRSEAEEDLEDGALDFLLVIPESFAELGTSSPGLPVQARQTGGDPQVSVPLLYSKSEDRRTQLVIEAISHVVGRANLRLSGTPQAVEVEVRRVEANRAEYFDVLLIGLVGLGMMTNSIIFIAVKISLYRNQSILKRPAGHAFAGAQLLRLGDCGPHAAGPGTGGDCHRNRRVGIRRQPQGEPALGVRNRRLCQHHIPEHRLHHIGMGQQSPGCLRDRERGGDPD